MRRHPSIVLLGTFLGFALLAVIAVGLARPLLDDPAGKAAKTLLDERIETSRQIRRALATPIPPPEPLPPITAKPARAGSNTKPVAGGAPQTSKGRTQPSSPASETTGARGR